MTPKWANLFLICSICQKRKKKFRFSSFLAFKHQRTRYPPVAGFKKFFFVADFKVKVNIFCDKLKSNIKT